MRGTIVSLLAPRDGGFAGASITRSRRVRFAELAIVPGAERASQPTIQPAGRLYATGDQRCRCADCSFGYAERDFPEATRRLLRERAGGGYGRSKEISGGTRRRVFELSHLSPAASGNPQNHVGTSLRVFGLVLAVARYAGWKVSGLHRLSPASFRFCS